MNEDETPEELSSALREWGRSLDLLGDRLRPHAIADAWIAGLVSAGIAAGHAKVWNGKYPRALPFVVEFPCPFDHRTEDQYDYARVRLIIHDDGGPSLDPESPCKVCTSVVLERWLLTCTRCEAGEVSGRHEPEHDPLWQGVIRIEGQREIEGDTSPVAFVVREFMRMAMIATARRWIEHTDEALAAEGGDRPLISSSGRTTYLSWRLAWAREALGARSKASGAAATELSTKNDPKMTAEDVVKWLDGLTDSDGAVLVPSGATVRRAWDLVKEVPGRPSKNSLEAALRLRSTAS